MAGKTRPTNAPSRAIDAKVGSPANKRPCPSHSGSEGTPLTLELFQSTIQPLIAKIGSMDSRVSQVETQFTERMQEQVNLLTAITNTQSQHTNDLIALQQQDKHTQESITTLQERLAKLETQPQATARQFYHYGGRQAASSYHGRLGRRPGSKHDTPTCKRRGQEPAPGCGHGGGFVPGIRRGYLVVPYGPRNRESDGSMHGRLTAAIQKVRQAHQATGALNPDGQPKHLWLAYSQTPERRKRARYAGKVKRLLLEQGAEKEDLQVEFATGTLWYKGRRIASATAPAPQGQPITKSALGWLDSEAVASYTNKSKDAIVAAWHALLDPLMQ